MADAPTPYPEIADVLARLPLLLREARRARGLSVRATAGELGCSFATVSRIENGEECWLSNAVLVLRWLDARPGPAADAVGGSEATPPNAVDLSGEAARRAE